MHWSVTSPAARPLLAAAWMLSLSSCSTAPCAPAMPSPALPPMSCQVACPPVPELTDGSQPGLRRWAHDLLNLYHDCRRLHAACSTAIAPSDTDHDRHD